MSGSTGRPNCTTALHMGELGSMYEKFVNDKDISKVIKDPDEAFYNLIYSEFKRPLETMQFSNELSKGDLKGFQSRLDRLVKSAKDGTLAGKFASIMYTPEAFARKDPKISQLLDNYITVSSYYKGNTVNHDRSQTAILNSLKNEMKSLGLMTNSLSETGKRITRQTSQAKIDKLESEIQKTIVKIKQGDKDSEGRLRELLDDEANLYRDSELQVYSQFVGYIENALPKIIDSKLKANPDLKWDIGSKRKNPFFKDSDFGRIKDKDGNVISGHMADALKEYVKLSDDLYWTLSRGVDKYIDTVMHGQTGKNKKQLKDMKANLKEKLMPENKKGYFPHFTRDLSIDFMDGLMAKLDDMVLSSNKYIKKDMSITEAIDNINGYISGHTKSQMSDTDAQSYSHNLPQVLSQYASNVNRFNYINSINEATSQVLNSMENMYKLGKDSSGYGDEVVNFINDLHRSATGHDNIKNPALSNMMRTILGFEFISKIGFNPRSAVRNVSQSMLNLVQFTPREIKSYRDFYSDPGMKKQLEDTMMKRGLLFKDTTPELQEILGTNPSLASSVRFNESTGKLEFVEVSKIAKAAGAVSNIAGKAGFMMARVENYNRKLTFGIGYSKMYKELDNFAFKKQVRQETLKRNPDYSDAQLDAAVVKRHKYLAEQYATNMTVALHFDYNSFSKAKGLRTKTGQVVGQFQHYAFKFFERNMEYLGKAKNDVLAGDLNGHNLWRATRLGLAYFIAPAIATSLTGVEFGNILEHDSSEKIKKLGIGLFGDDEAAEEAFYGKGPIIGSIGFPVYSDLVNIGMMLDIINMDDDSMLTYLAGLKDTNEKYDDDRLRKVIQLLNPAINRGFYRHLPQIQQGNIGWVAQSELGLYPTKEAKKQQEKFQESTSPELFELIEELQKRGR